MPTKYRRGTKNNPFEVGERVRTNYFRGAANDREWEGTVKEVDCWADDLSFDLRRHMRYLVIFDDSKQHPINRGGKWMTCRNLESIAEDEEEKDEH